MENMVQCNLFHGVYLSIALQLGMYKAIIIIIMYKASTTVIK